MTQTKQKIQWLYLIASGNNDGVYKIGISQNVDQRLEQIRSSYEVPNAYIVQVMNVSTRGEVFAIEKALHERFDRKRAKGYTGREWFSLSSADLDALRAMYQEESDSFAQATAFFGIVQEAASLKTTAAQEEAERQKLITFNRRYGKTHDTRPSPLLARYKRLQDRMLNGVLGDRFAFKIYRHPALDLRDKAATAVGEAAEKALKPLCYQAAFIGFVGGIACTAAAYPESALGAGIGGGFIGFIGGGMTAVSKPQEEKEAARVAFDIHVCGVYPNCHDQTLSAVLDRVDQKSYLVSALTESTSELRNQAARMPRVAIPSLQALTKERCEKPFWPRALATVMGGYFLLLGGSSINELDRQERQQNTSYLSYPHLVGFSSG